MVDPDISPGLVVEVKEGLFGAAKVDGLEPYQAIEGVDTVRD